MTLLFSVLLTYFLDPIVVWLERIRFPRALGAMLVLLFSFSVLAGVGYLRFGRLDQFSADWPQYSAAMRRVTTEVNGRLNTLNRASPRFRRTDHTKDRCLRAAGAAPSARLAVEGLGLTESCRRYSSRHSYLFWFSSCSRASGRSGTLRSNYFRCRSETAPKSIRRAKQHAARLHSRERVFGRLFWCSLSW